MRVLLVLIFGYLLLALEPVVGEALTLGSTTATPSLLLPFIVFIALHAPTMPALWTGLLIGLAVDISTQRTGPPGVEMVLPGPMALSYLGAAYLVLLIRPLLMRKNPLATITLSLLAGSLAAIIFTAIMFVRMIYSGSWEDGFGLSIAQLLRDKLLSTLYTLLTAVPMAMLLHGLMPLFNFQESGLRRSYMRR